MYTFSIAAAVSGVTIDLPPMPNAIMSQPPADKDVGTAAVLHYTWGSFFKVCYALPLEELFQCMVRPGLKAERSCTLSFFSVGGKGLSGAHALYPFCGSGSPQTDA